MSAKPVTNECYCKRSDKPTFKVCLEDVSLFIYCYQCSWSKVVLNGEQQRRFRTTTTSDQIKYMQPQLQIYMCVWGRFCFQRKRSEKQLLLIRNKIKSMSSQVMKCVRMQFTHEQKHFEFIVEVNVLRIS